MFSRRFQTFNSWLAAQSQRTEYVRRIMRLHERYPGVSLGQLRRHPGPLMALGRLKARPTARLSAAVLSSRDQVLQQKAFEVARFMRHEKSSFTAATHKAGISSTAARRLLGPALRRRSGKLTITKRDTLPRVMRMLDERGEYWITTQSSQDASKISGYWTMLSKWKKSNPRDNALLQPFSQLTVTDETGQQHKFLTDPKALERIFRSREARFESVYAYAVS
jgi:hypothetical protein